MKREAKHLAFGLRLRDARKAAGLTGPELAEKAGVSPQAYQQWEAGITMPRGAERQQTIARIVGKTINELFFDEPAPPPSMFPVRVWDDMPDESDYIFLPELQIERDGAQAVGWMVDIDGKRQAYPRSLAERLGIDPEAAAVMTMGDQSMAPRLQEGDLLVVECTPVEVITDGLVYVVLLEGEMQVRRLFKEFGDVRITCDSQDKARFRDRTVPEEKMGYVQIVGQVKGTCGAV
ncbi:LexA family transcriptional regulator [Paludibacterium purpuratum]|uniref:Peptidase S24-like protein n=1 Tax=Paludibacterium purpuratum TaxID=1144873 RepID=A0A4R7BBZ6_9NEIS|nr:LexA family transcriptional regulator [Paludibacterium purpuratum]TDR82183.1 peptidase S24-like protein [Paludibacterium purpuratum]